MKKLFALVATIVVGGLSAQTFTVGSGNCLDFAANIANANHVDLGSLSSINTGDFSFECWMKVNSVDDDEAFFSNKNWASGNNTGFVFDVQDGGSNMKFNFKDPSNARKDLTVAVNVLNRDWYHFAGTFKRGGYFVVYINGVAKDSMNISSITGSFASSYTYKLGQDGTGNYSYLGNNPRYNGKIDEVRIWTDVRSKQEIRDNMCKKLSGTEANLYAYYNCDAASGTVLTDVSANGNSGTLINSVASNWATSAAAIGNESVNAYSTNFGSSSIQITDAAYGDFSVKNISATAGIHLYRVNTAPNSIVGLNNLAGNTNYYGVFATDTNSTLSYDVEYGYTNFATAISDEPNLILFNRVKNDGIIWSDYFAVQNATSNLLTKTFINDRKEFILGTKTGVACNAPTALTLQSNTANSSTVGWTSGGFTNWNIQWGAPGFTLGNGTNITNTTNNPTTFTGLAGSTFYDMYVQEMCSGINTSYWVGPFTFYPSVCLVPNALSATNITSNSATLGWNGAGSLFDIEWGLPGFTPGTGIPVNNVTNPYTLTGLGPNTSYSFYVRTDCGTGNASSYNGPYTFTTAPNTTSIADKNSGDIFSVFPNPTNGIVHIVLKTEMENAEISVTDLVGKVVFTNIVKSRNEEEILLDLKNAAKGIYMVRVKSGTTSAIKKIVLY